MKLCDLTLAYTEVSGGIRTYIDEKRRYLLANTEHEHILIVPWANNEIIRNGRATTVRIASPICPGCAPYRMFVRPDKVRAALERTSPDAVELASFFLSPGAAFRFRSDKGNQGRKIMVSGYFHTDLAEAYVGAPVRRFLGGGVASVARRVSEWWFGSIFRRCDLLFAATEAQARRMSEYGTRQSIDIIPLGVDLNVFHPRRRSTAMRKELGASDDEILLFYGGRLDREKHVDVLLDQFALLAEGRFRLVLRGEGPEREALEERAATMPGVAVLSYERNRERFASMLASSDIYVTAGPHETFGLSIVEAMASGLPVVGVESGAMLERVSRETGRLGPVDDAAAFARNVQEVGADRERMGRNAREAVEAGKYGWDESFRKLVGIHEELADSSGQDW